MAILMATMPYQTSRCSTKVKFAHVNIASQRPLNPKIFHQPFPNILHHPANTWSNITTSSNQLKHPPPFNPLKSYQNSFCNNTIISQEDTDSKIESLVKSVRRVIAELNDESLEDLIMVDALQRLAIDYHLKDEINLILTRRYLQLTTNTKMLLAHHHYNLFETSLNFRILRQNGFYISADIFMKFKGSNKRFDEKWKDDVEGLMALYEASQFSTGDYEKTLILDEAQDFSRRHLHDHTMKFLDDGEAERIRHTLENPYHNTLPLYNLNKSIKYFNGTAVLEELAEQNFNKQQTIHQRELEQISRWWKDMGLGQELSLARDQHLKWYLWAMTALTTPNLSQQRIDLTKIISLIYIIDDIFDVYGTIEDLTIFTHAINRWDIKAIEQLPSYMKSSFKAVYDVTNDIANKIYEQYGFNPISFFQKSWATLCDAFLLEAKWFRSGHIPKANEYLKNGMVTSGIHVVLIQIFFLVSNVTNEEHAGLINDNHHIISSVAKILRLWDDFGSAQDENQEGHDGSYIMCYLNEHEGCSMKIARERVINLISDAWKRLNKDCLRPNNPFSDDFTKAAIGMARLVPLMYSYGEKTSLPLLDDYVKVMLAI